MDRRPLLSDDIEWSNNEVAVDDSVQQERNGIYELTEYGVHILQRSEYYNKDLAPTSIYERTWGIYHVAMLWVGMAISIPTYMLAAGLIAEGLTWFEALLTIAVGNFIILVPIQLNSHAGTKYGVPYPVFARLSFGLVGSQFPSIIRAIIAAGWFGIQCWIGGTAMNQMLSSASSFWASWDMAIWISFFSFWALNLLITLYGTEGVKYLESLGVPILVGLCIALVIWAYYSVLSVGKGIVDIFSIPPAPSSSSSTLSFYSIIFLAITANVGFWSTMALNIPDFSRFARNQRSQFFGQLFALPAAMTCISFAGIFVTGSAYVLYGEYIWDPVQVIERIESPIASSLGALGVTIATLTTNIAANVVAPANGIANIYPKYTTYRVGVIVTCILGVLIMPWKFLSSSNMFIFGWLATYSVFLGPLAGIFVADYYIYRHKRLELISLYKKEYSLYWYSAGINVWAIVTWIVCCYPVIGKLFYDSFLHYLWDCGWLLGFLSALILYPLLMFCFDRNRSLVPDY